MDSSRKIPIGQIDISTLTGNTVSGITNRISKFTGTTTLGSSISLTELSNGYVGIGTDTPSSPLHVNSSIDSVYVRIQGAADPDNYGALELWNSTASSKWQFAHKSIAGQTKDFSFTHYNGTSWKDVMRLTNLFNVLINQSTDNTIDKLQVGGPAIATAWKTLSGTSTQFVRGDGTLALISSISSSGSIGGTGTTNYIPKWSNTTGLTNSIIFNSGITVGINTTSTNALLNILAPTANTAENIVEVMVSDSPNNKFLIANATKNDIAFSPAIVGYTQGLDIPTGYSPLTIRGLGTTADDVPNTSAYISFVGANTNNLTNPNIGNLTAPSNRPIMTFAGGGTSYMTLTAYGNLVLKYGLAFDNLVDKLQVDGNILATSFKKQYGAANEYLMADGSVSTGSGISGTGNANYIPKWTSSTELANSIIYTTSNLVGINKTNPLSTIDVEGNSLSIARFASNSAGANKSIEFTTNSVGINLKATFWADTTPVAIVLNPSAGNTIVGQPTDNLLDKLQVGGNVLANGFKIPSGTAAQYLMADGSVSTGSGGSIGGTGTTNYISKWSSTTGLTNSIIFDNGTNLGIGTTGPDGKLHIVEITPIPQLTVQTNVNRYGIPQFTKHFVRHYNSTTGTILTIPFTSQGSINTKTMITCDIIDASNNGSTLYGASFKICVNSLATVTSLTSLQSLGNIASITTSGSNVLVTFASPYNVDGVNNGITVDMRILTSNKAGSIDYGAITMN